MFPHLATARILLFTTVVVSCAAYSAENSDPWEKTNRKIYTFNKRLDTYALKPIAKGYRAITPQHVDESITRFFDNLKEPLVAINNGLQGKGGQAANDVGRFVVNTVTSLGFFDVANKVGLSRHQEDFGQTFGKWGAPSGAYIMLPFLGPSTVRDALARPLDSLTNPRNAIDNTAVNVAVFSLEIVDTRADIIPVEKVIEGDEYLLLRDVYLQRREFLVQDGKVNDSFIDDMDDEAAASSKP
jgi:phospholipid-binding lipoprotein MlaA